jgi:hypothetical protein
MSMRDGGNRVEEGIPLLFIDERIRSEYKERLSCRRDVYPEWDFEIGVKT